MLLNVSWEMCDGYSLHFGLTWYKRMAEVAQKSNKLLPTIEINRQDFDNHGKDEGILHQGSHSRLSALLLSWYVFWTYLGGPIN